MHSSSPACLSESEAIESEFSIPGFFSDNEDLCLPITVIMASPYLHAIFDLRAIFCKFLWGKQV